MYRTDMLLKAFRQAACVVVVSGGGGRDRTDDPLLAKQVLSQLSYAPSQVRDLSQTQGLETTTVVVGQGGLEPPTPRLSSVCSNQLSY